MSRERFLAGPVWNRHNDSGSDAYVIKRWTKERVEKEYDEIKVRAGNANIRSSAEYNVVSRDDKSLDLPSYPTLSQSKTFQQEGWAGFLGVNFEGRRWTVEKVEYEYEAIKAKVQKAKIKNSREYFLVSQDNKILDLPSYQTLTSSKEFKREGWAGFLGENFNGRRWMPEQLEQEYQNIKALVQNARISNTMQYTHSTRNGNRLNLPSLGALVKTTQFQREGWPGFFGENYSGDANKWSVEEVEQEFDTIKKRTHKLGIRSSNQYIELSRVQMNNDLPSIGTLMKAKRFQKEGWPGFLGKNYSGEAYKWTVQYVEAEYENIKARAQSAKIRSSKYYYDVSLSQKELNLPSLPTLVKSSHFKKEGWSGFLGHNHRDKGFLKWSNERVEQEYDEIKERAQSAKIHSSKSFKNISRKRKDLNLPDHRRLTGSARFQKEGWSGFLGENYSGDALNWDPRAVEEQYEEIKARVQKAKIQNSSHYIFTRKKNKLLDLPSMGTLIKSKHFQKEGWSGFLGENYSGREQKISELDREVELDDFLNESNLRDELLACIHLFGFEFALDLIYKWDPKFQDVPREKMRGKLSKIIGEFHPTSGSLGYVELEFGAMHLGAPDQQIVFSSIVRQGCLEVLLNARKAGFKDDAKVARAHIESIRSRLAKVMTPELEKILKNTEAFFCKKIHDYRKSSRMIGELRSDRPFPDIYQQINCGEIEEKKRLLIADEMGVGKSASAIFAKEALGVNCAVVIVPANVQDTWRGYLTDQIKDGQQKGYFKKGKAPKVLFLDKTNVDRVLKERFDYIVLSQEKLTSSEGYTEALAQLPFDMLIVDEIHKLKNVKGVRAEAILTLSEKLHLRNGYMALLSGTPIPNKVEDVAMLLKLLHPEKFSETSNRELVGGIIQGQVATRSLLAPYMQMKSLAEHIEMPELKEERIEVKLSKQEALTHRSILQDDNYTASEKIAELRRFLLNPRLLQVKYPNSKDFVPSKAAATGAHLTKVFKEKKKAVLFVNDFISGVIRGENTIIPDLKLPKDVRVRFVHGEDKGREEEIRAFQEDDEKCLLVVSGDTMDVGVDLSAAEHVVFYNDPWTLADKRQQIARVYRPGLKKPLTVTTMETKGTIEEGIRHYLEIKQRAIEKILRGGIVSDVEKEILLKGEKFTDENLAVHSELAEFYFAATDKINRVYFGALKYGGEKRMREFLDTEHGEKYAEYYEELTDYSYQANSNRVSGALIHALSQERGIARPKVLDMASGPEMLATHMPEGKHDVMSVDINPHHFENRESIGRTKVASHRSTGEPAGTYDFVNLSLALNHEQLVPGRGIYDSAEVLYEMARVLKVGGIGIINEMYSVEFKNIAKLSELFKTMGLKIVRKYSGDAVQGANYCSRLITFEKVRETPQKTEDFFSAIPNHAYDGLKLTKSTRKLRGQNRMISEFQLGSRKFTIPLNRRDNALLKEETEAVNAADSLKRKYGAIEKIPDNELDKYGFGRRLQRTKYVLFKETSGEGLIVIR